MDESSGSAVNNVARAISAAFDWNSPPGTRNAAVAFLDSFKSGDIRVLASTSFQLVRKEWSSEIRLHGFKMLQHLVRFRWDEFGISERTEFANATVNLILEMANPTEEWVLKSQTAALVAEVVRREGINLWQELLPSLVSLSNKGPVEAELVAMMLRWLPEDITVHNEDLEGDRRRVLLRGLTESLTEILPLLYSLLEKHFGAALSESGMQHFDIAKQHAATVTSALNAINAYAEWAPVPDLAKCGLIHGCGFLLSSLDFRLHACEFFKLVSQRKRPADATAPDFDSAMKNIFEILMNISREFLSRFGSSVAAIDESDLEFVECLCESMVALGSSHLQSITVDGSMISLFLQQMLGYFQHFKFSLHFQSLLFWLALMRESAPKAKAAAQIAGNNPSVSSQGFGSAQLENEKKGISAFIDDGICAAILDVSFQRMLKKNVTPGSVTSNEALELWNDEFDGKSDFSQYRSRLLELIRLVTSQKPMVTVARVSQRIQIIVESCAHLSLSAQDIALMESMQLGLETVVTTIFDGSAVFVISSSELKFQLHRILEGLLQQLLSMKWAEAAVAVVHARYLDSFGSYLKHFPDAVVGVVTKLFELLRSLPIQTDPSNTARFARLQVCSSFIRIARSAEESLIPQMKDIADSMARLEGEGLLLRSEHNILGEAVLIMASFAGSQQQQEVLAWLLGPLSKQWMQLEWQNAYLSNPLGLTQLCTDTQFMWSIFHTVTFFEKALKRSGFKKANLHLQSCSTNSNSTHPHPLSSHLTWMLPPLLRLLRSVHSLWSPPIDQALTGELRAAKCMSHVEHVSLLGEGNFKLPKDQSGYVDGIETTETKESNMRNWLKCIRDSGYNVVGLATTIGDAFFRCIDNHSVTLALMENIQSMEFRHLRQLIHSVLIPLVKSCPVDLWSTWLENLLQPLFLHCHQVLTCSWSCLVREGRAKIPDNFGNLSGMDLKVEVMEEKLLRDLTREVCLLLSVLASSGLNSGLPSLEQLGNANRMEASLGDLDVFASNSMIGFFMKHKGLALPALRICIEAFAWTDGEAVSKLTHFCGTLIHLAVASNDVELREFIAKDLFYAIIQGLALESNAIISADLVGLCREIFVYLSDRDPAPRQVILSLPCITRDDLVAFEDNLTKTTSAKEQKQLMRSLLISATGNKLKALVAQKPTNTITNVTARNRTSARTTQNIQEDSLIGLAAIT